MKKFLMASATVGLMASGAVAQTVQTGVTGNSGNPNYPVQVSASDGQTYNCKADITTVAGVATRTCVSASGAVGGLAGAGAGLGAGAGAAAAGLIVLAVAAGGSSSTTTTSP